MICSGYLLQACFKAGEKWLNSFYSKPGINYDLIKADALMYAIYNHNDEFAIYLLENGVAPVCDNYGEKIPLLQYINMLNRNNYFPAYSSLIEYLEKH